MAGGRGTRFWPRSRRKHAKQVLPVLGDRSLIQQTYARLRPLVDPDRFLVITNAHLRDEIARQLPEIPGDQVIAEPAQRNTAPCVALAARILLARDPEAVMGVFPADHVISQEDLYRDVLRQAIRLAEAGNLVVLGIQPRWPETGYGYIEFDGDRVLGFREKPDLPTAEDFVRRGNFYWNSGQFLWKAAVIDRAIRQFLPQTAAALDQNDFLRCENISIDYGVMEKATNIAGLRCPEIGWNDVGSWNAVYELLAASAGANVPRSPALFHQAQGCYVDAPGKLVAVVGLDDIIVVETSDALLIVRRDRAQQVGDVVKTLEQQKREDLL